MSRWLAVGVLLLGGAAVWPASTAAQPEGDVVRGEAIYQASCAMCHGADATGMMGMHPALTGVVQRLTVEGVEVAIRQGRDTRPPMPAFGEQFGDDDITDLIAYLDTLPPGPRNFGPDSDGMPMGGGGMMRDMMDGRTALLWLVIVMLAAVAAGLIGYLIGLRRR